MLRAPASLSLWSLLGPLLLGAGGCRVGGGPSGVDGGGRVGDCAYPDAPAIMTQGAPLPRFSWPEALDGDRENAELDLLDAYCDTDEARAWSPFDALLFISIPAW